MQQDVAARNVALAGLEPFIGEWTLDASIAPGLLGQTRFEWILDGQFMVQHSEIPHPEAPDGYSIIGVSLDGATYTQHYFDSRGVARLYEMSLGDGVWELLRTSADFSPLDFSQHYIGRFSDDGNAIEGRWETSKDASTWELDFDMTYRRVG